MKHLKNTIIFAIICLTLISVLNLFGMGISYTLSFLFNEYTVWEYLGAGALHATLIFVLVLVGGIKYSSIYVPIIYLGFCLFLFSGWDKVSGYDFIFHLNFAFSRFFYVIYEFINKTSWLTTEAMNFILFNGLFFVYQMGLLYLTRKTFINIYMSK
jgi:hypothetical protein